MIFDKLLQDLDPSRSLLATREGRPTAAAFAFHEEAGLLVDGAGKAGWPAVLFDGHVTDRHFYPALQEVPHRSGQGLHLLQLGLTD